MTSELRVGIIGVSAKRGWACDAHVPALRVLSGMALAAVAASRQQAADEAAHAFGVGKAYGEGMALIADPEIDVVTVATRVPEHRDLILAAVAAGKHVYAEWPLGRGTAESVEIAAATEAAGVRSAIGLQLRGSPAVALARDIVASGTLGRTLSLSALSTTAVFGPEVIPEYAYTEDPATYANLITIQGAHTLDLLLALGGDIAGLSALTSRQFPEVRVQGTDQRRNRIIHDHMLAQGRFDTGMPFTMEVAGGRAKERPSHVDVVGERGILRLDGDGAPRGFQAGRIGLLLDGKRLSIDEGDHGGLSDGAVNVAGVYAALRDDIVNGTSNATGFAHALRLTRLIDEILASPGH